MDMVDVNRLIRLLVSADNGIMSVTFYAQHPRKRTKMSARDLGCGATSQPPGDKPERL